jgi:ComF family protein
LREAIRALKFGGCRALAGPLGDLVVAAIVADGLRADVVVPVPLHRSRLRERGFNQAELLGHRVARALGLPCDAGMLRRRHSTDAQSRLTREARAANVRGKFITVRRAGRSAILLVDDVMSTGSTASECARSLLAAGAREVLVATVALAVLTLSEGQVQWREQSRRR